MAQHVILNHPTVSAADRRRADKSDWSPRTKLFCVLTCGIASWAMVLAPFFLVG
jgi:hypothetical protein